MQYQAHPQAIIESTVIGKGTRIWAFAHILAGAKIGADCNICDHVFIENDVIIGDRVTIKNGVQLWDGVRIEDDVFIGPNASFTNDHFPRSKHYTGNLLTTVVKQGASIGANATVLPGLIIGKNAMVGAGSVVTRNVPQNAIVVGNPANITGYVSQSSVRKSTMFQMPVAAEPQVIKSVVRGVSIYNLPIILDMRGSLSVAEYGQYLPFIPHRYFLVFDVVSKKVRGEHAHKTLHEFLVCPKGSCAVVVDDGANSQEIVLEAPNVAVHIPPMVWTVQYKYTKDAVLLVLASDVYKPEDYIRDYDEFLQAVEIK
ncbi:MAG: WxcM-like domain-containing protein [Spirochaetes bacterium]|nr:WxcM-like domain-containing protein [Spirochaetota bacterium]